MLVAFVDIEGSLKMKNTDLFINDENPVFDHLNYQDQIDLLQKKIIEQNRKNVEINSNMSVQDYKALIDTLYFK